MRKTLHFEGSTFGHGGHLRRRSQRDLQSLLHVDGRVGRTISASQSEPGSPTTPGGKKALESQLADASGGQHCLAREQRRVRLKQQRAWQEEQKAKHMQTPWDEWPKKEAAPADVILELSAARPPAQHVSQAKAKGESVVLWHSRTSESRADAAQLQARRRRLTDAMLSDVASRTGEKAQAVQWWFRIFEFYCARAADRWPSLEDLPVQESGPESDADRLRRRRRSVSAGLRACRRHLEACGGGRSRGLPKRSASLGTVAPGEGVADGGFQRMTLRENVKGPPQAQRRPDEWTQCRWDDEKDRCAEELHGIHQQKGLLDLISRARTEDLDTEKLKEWLSHYEVHKLLKAGIDPMMAIFSLASQKGDGVESLQTRQEMARRTHAVQDFLESVQSEKADEDPVDFEEIKSVFSSRFAKAKEETGKQKELFSLRTRPLTPTRRDRTPSESSGGQSSAGDAPTGELLMLNASSYALLSSGLWSKAPEARERVDRHEQLRRAGARILRETVPVDMDLDNWAHLMSMWGVTTIKPVSMTFELLEHAVPLAASSRQSAQSTHRAGIPRKPTLQFESFYALARALCAEGERADRGAAREPRAAARFEAPRPASPLVWAGSSLLKRLIFYALTDRKGAQPDAGSAAVWAADHEEFSLRLERVEEGVLLMTSMYVAGPEDGEGEAHALSAERRRRFDVTARQLAECLHGCICAAQVELREDQEGHANGVMAGSRPRSAGALGRPRTAPAGGAAARACAPGPEDAASFVGFERFVARQPQVFALLVQLLIPLATEGARLMSEEMQAAARCLPHRTAEMRMGVMKQAQKRQRGFMDELHRTFTLQHQHLCKSRAMIRPRAAYFGP